MKLTTEQKQQFDRDGYLFFPGLFRPEEIKVLTDEVPALYAQQRPENVREKTGDAVRTNFAAHMYSKPFARLARHPRMVEPMKQLFGEDVYMHQFKINGKQAFDGDVWQWHQDYGTWQERRPDARAAGDERRDLPRRGERVQRAADVHPRQPQARRARCGARHSPPPAIRCGRSITTPSRKLVERGGIVAPKGPAGSMILFHGCLVHASTSNLSPWNRVSVYLSLCAVSNHIRRFKRPGYIAHRDFTPIQCLPDDCLLRHYDVPLPWKDGTPAEELQAAVSQRRMNLYAKLAASGTGQAAAHRRHRRRQVRRDVPRAGAEDAGRASGRHRRSVARRMRRTNLERIGWSPDAYAAPSLDAALKEERTHLSDDWEALVAHPGIDIIIEATGNPPAAVDHALAAFRNGKHVVMVTVEADAFCGPAARAQGAQEAGVVYSLAYGDQPALICDLVDWARAAGFPVVAAGRGHKWLPHFAQSTPETVWGYYGLTPEQAKVGGLNPKMFNSFLDGSKPAIETSRGVQRHRLDAGAGGPAVSAGSRRRDSRR